MFEISCKTRENIDQLMEYVIEKSKKLKTKAEEKKESVILTSNINPKSKYQNNNSKGESKCNC